MSEELNFDDLAPIEIPVKVGGKAYLLREASGDAACKWRNALLKATRLGPEGKPVSIDGMADTEPLLISLCLFETADNGDGSRTATKPVSIATIRSWPARVQAKLFAKCKDISALDETETEEALRKRLEDTQRKLDALQNGSAEKNDAITAGTDGSN